MKKHYSYSLLILTAFCVLTTPIDLHAKAGEDTTPPVSRLTELKYQPMSLQVDLLQCYLSYVQEMQNCSINYIAGTSKCNEHECADTDFLCLLKKQSCQQVVEMNHLTCTTLVNQSFNDCLQRELGAE